ncbi:MAG: hypothetical protein ACLQU1_38475 [Bryobacteraceae bacterium]
MTLSTLPLGAAVKVEKTAWQGWPNCYRIANGEVELIVTGDVGPRIMRYGFAGGQNVFKEFAEQLGKSGEGTFQLRGGHRLWKAPEDAVGSWAPDNVPVEVHITPQGVVAREPVEPLTGLQKEIEVALAPEGSAVTVTHRLYNRGIFPLEFSAWAMSMMAPGGQAITGFPPRGKHPDVLPPTNPLVMWAYSDLSDKRWTFTKKYMGLRQDPANPEPTKLGLFNPRTWVAYLLRGEMFLKQAQADPAKQYPDFGCSFETFTNGDFLEMETLSPLTKVPPAGSVSHVEHWNLYRNMKLEAFTDTDLDRLLLPLLH